MTTSPRSKNPSEHDPPPGADRFWGQFAQAGKAKDEGHGPDPGADADRANGNGTGQAREQGHGHECLEWCPICRSAELLRHAATPEMAQQVLTLQKEATNVLKAFVQAYAEKSGEDPFATGNGSRTDSGPGRNGHKPEDEDPGPKVTDITID